MTLLDNILQEVSKELDIPEDIVTKIYKGYWKMIKDYIESLPLKDNLSEEEFMGLRPNINIPSLGKFYVTYDMYKNIKERYKEYEDNKSKEHTTNI